MSLKLALLKKVKHRPNKIEAQCPACAETGGDSKGVHLVVYPDGRFGCTANPKDKPHRRRIAELAGDPNRQIKPWTLRLHGKIVLSAGQPPSCAGRPIASLAREHVKSLQQSAVTPSETSETAFSDKTDAQNPIGALENVSNCTCTAPSTGGQNVHTIRGSANPSEVSETGFSDTSDASNPIGHLENVSSRVVAVGTGDRVTATVPGLTKPSETSENTVAKALALFDGKVAAVISPDAIVPGCFRDVLATWTPTRNHPGLHGYTPRRIRGWTKRGKPIYHI